MITQPFKEYQKEELKSARFFYLRICTSGLDNPKKLDEAFNYEYACSDCKAGRIPNEELHLPSNRMGKKKVDQNLRYGYLIFDKELVKRINESNLKGIDFRKAILGREFNQFLEGRVLNTFPKLTNNSILHTEDLCKTCGKSGHYNTQTGPTEYWAYKKDLEKLDKDIYLTWEHFRIWNKGQTYPLPIVNQQFRKVIYENSKLRHLRFEPIFEQE